MRAALFAAMFWLAAAVQAAPLDVAPVLTRFRRMSTEQGLSQATAWTLAQDRHGWLWIGTQDGLNRFDGHEFRVYRHRPDDPGSLPGNLVLALAIDRQGVLWVGGNGGLARYVEAEDRFEAVPIAGESGQQAEVRGLHIDRNGVLWVASYAGLSRWDPSSGQRRAWVFAPGNRPPDTRFESLASDAQGRIWLGSLGGLARLEPASGRVEQPYAAIPAAAPLARTRIDALLVDTQDVLWVGAVAEGLFRLDAVQGDLRVFRHAPADPGTLNSDIIRSLLRDRQGRLWIGTREGLNLMATPDQVGARVQRYAHHRNDPTSLGSGRVMSLLEAGDGSLLAGTHTGGLSVLNPRGNRFTSFTADSAATAGLLDPVIYSLLPAGEALWLGGRKGLYRFNPRHGDLQLMPATAALGISAIAAEGERLWLGVLGGAVIFDPRNGKLEVPKLPAPLDSVQITRLWLEGDRLIAGTYDRGLFVLRRSDLALLRHYPIASWVSQIEAFDANTLLVTASDGLHWLSRDGLRERHHHRASGEPGAALPAGGITQFLRASDGRLWLASATAGLLQLHLDDPAELSGARFQRYPQFAAQGLDNVQAIAEDARGQLWLSSSRGLARFDPASGRIERFGAADGAFDADYQSTAVAALADGRLAFAATRGFSLFDPARITAAPAPSAPVLTELRLWNRRIEPRPNDAGSPLPQALHLSSALSIPAGEARMLGLRFAALDLAAPERLRYAYRLEGFDPGWIHTPASERSATYTNLAPGHYLFRVKVGTGADLEGAPSTALVLEILPPWWQTLWARLLFAVAVLAALSAGYRWRIHRIESQRRQLQQQVAERTAELSQAKQRAEQALVELRETQRGLIEAEKMASLGSLVAGVAHELNTPLGNALTASSLLAERTAAVRQLFDSGAMKRSDLAAFLGTAGEASALVRRSLERTAELVDRFKQISVDHTTDERRTFVLADYLQTVLPSLEHLWKRRPITLQLDLEPGLALDSYPGALAQVVASLIHNALQHGFDAEQAGTIRIQARGLDGERVELVVADDGRGIPAELLPQVFEPFFTTRRSEGATGLGLHVVYNLVNARLGGQIEIRSDGAGTEVRIRLPLRAK